MAKNILVIKLSALGDFILALGAMEAIRKHHKDARITLLTTKPYLDMAKRSQYFDNIVLDERPKIHQVAGWARLFKKLNTESYDRVYDLQMNDRSAIYKKLIRSKPEWSGVVKGSPLFYDNPKYIELHAFRRHQEVLKIAGPDMQLPDLSWMATDISELAPKKPYILFIPGCAPQHPQKRWAAVRYGALAQKLVRQGYDVVTLGTAAEAEDIQKIKLACSEVIDLSGKTSFYDIASLARNAAGAVGNDTGPTHLVYMAGCPTVMLFSSLSNPALLQPIGSHIQTILSEDLKDLHPGPVFDALMDKTKKKAA